MAIDSLQQSDVDIGNRRLVGNGALHHTQSTTERRRLDIWWPNPPTPSSGTAEHPQVRVLYAVVRQSQIAGQHIADTTAHAHAGYVRVLCRILFILNRVLRHATVCSACCLYLL